MGVVTCPPVLFAALTCDYNPLCMGSLRELYTSVAKCCIRHVYASPFARRRVYPAPFGTKDLAPTQIEGPGLRRIKRLSTKLSTEVVFVYLLALHTVHVLRCSIVLEALRLRMIQYSHVHPCRLLCYPTSPNSSMCGRNQKI